MGTYYSRKDSMILKSGQYQRISIDKLNRYTNHPFKEYTDIKLKEMADSIKAHGILNAILVRTIPGSSEEYEIISGHNRVNAAKLAGLTSVDAIIKEMDDETAAIQVIEANLIQRHEISPCEKGRAYKMLLEALKKQGQRNDLIEKNLSSGQVGHKSARKEVALINGETETQIRRYISLANLLPEIQELVDNKTIAFVPAVNISILRESEQKAVYDIIYKEPKMLNIEASKKLRSESKLHELSDAEVSDIFSKNQYKSKKIGKPLKLEFDRISHYFSDKNESEEYIKDTILKALELYFLNKSD